MSRKKPDTAASAAPAVEVDPAVEVAPAAELEAVEVEAPTDQDTPAVEVASTEAAVTCVLSDDALSYLRLLLSHYISISDVEMGLADFVATVERGEQLLIRQDPMRVEPSGVNFYPDNADRDVSEFGIHLNVNRQLVHVRMLAR